MGWRKDPWFTFKPVCCRVVMVLSDFVKFSSELLPFVINRDLERSRAIAHVDCDVVKRMIIQGFFWRDLLGRLRRTRYQYGGRRSTRRGQVIFTNCKCTSFVCSGSFCQTKTIWSNATQTVDIYWEGGSEQGKKSVTSIILLYIYNCELASKFSFPQAL